MDCRHIEVCASCSLILDYNKQISYKTEFLQEKFSQFFRGEIEIFTSSPMNYRSRGEFGLFRDGDELYYTMHDSEKKRIKVENCMKVDLNISNFMPILLRYIKEIPLLKEKIFGVEFISTSKELAVILLYHKNVELIKKELEILQDNLHFNELKIHLIARSKGKKLIFSNDSLGDKLMVDGRIFRYKFGDNAFLQPNKKVNEKMISWAISCIEGGRDFLEMYCGHGNFTIPLSFKFNRVLATEISKNSIKNALINCTQNSVTNIKFARISSEELMSAFAKERKFNRLAEVNLDEYDFSHILVDPPRAGLDDSVMEFIKKYENIIYISCNPDTMYDDLTQICKTHKVVRFAFFDQFPHTAHIECGALLMKI